MEFDFRPVEKASLVQEGLSDGSCSLFDRSSKTVYSLNAPAVAAFQACQTPAGLADVARAMGEGVSDSQALDAVEKLADAGLVEIRPGRREVLKKVVAVVGGAIAAVLVLSVSEQKAYAGKGGSQPV